MWVTSRASSSLFHGTAHLYAFVPSQQRDPTEDRAPEGLGAAQAEKVRAGTTTNTQCLVLFHTIKMAVSNHFQITLEFIL